MKNRITTSVLSGLLILALAFGAWQYKANTEYSHLVASAAEFQQQVGVAIPPNLIHKVDSDQIYTTSITTSDNVTHVLIQIGGVWGEWRR